jgi:hypothetical protein
MLFFENQDSGREMRGYPFEVQRGGESCRPAAEDEDVFFHIS